MNSKNCRKILEKLFAKAADGISNMPNKKQKVFLTYSYGKDRALTINGKGNTINTAFNAVRNTAVKKMEKKEIMPKWIMLDIVTNEENLTVEEYYQRLRDTRRGYLRYGISFDESYDTAFLEQELYGNSLIRYIKRNEQYFNTDNIRTYLKRHKGLDFTLDIHEDMPLIMFETKSYFYDEGEYVELESSSKSLLKGIRNQSFDIDGVNNESALLDFIDKSAVSLISTLKEDGAFVYGYFSCFNGVVPGYNVPRHTLAAFALADLYMLNPQKKYKDAALLALDYMINNFVYHYNDDIAFIIDEVKEGVVEIKLGALGMSILAIARCLDITDDKEKYLPILRKIGNGILYMQDKETGNFVHVLHYPSLELKELFRIVFYAGEAAFALLRLYTADRDPKWLNAVEHAFEYFIENDYHKYSDHWLAYAVNELSLYKTDDKYFEFGLRNIFYDLDFIIHRDTTWNTFLEMLNASYFMVRKIQDLEKYHLLKPYNLEKFHLAMETRFNLQRASVMFPEMAMFFKSPQTILHGIFIRHHSFRVRNDDGAHHLMGYSNYFRNKFIDATLQERWNKKIRDVNFIHDFIWEEVSIYHDILTEKHTFLEGSVTQLAEMFEVRQEVFYGFLLGIEPMVNANLSKIKPNDAITIDLNRQNLREYLKQKQTFVHLLDLEGWAD